MLIECMSALSVVGLLIVALLIMIRAITTAQLAQALGRGLVVLFGGIIALCTFKTVLSSLVIPWLLSLKSSFGWLVAAVAGAIIVVLLARIALSKYQS